MVESFNKYQDTSTQTMENIDCEYEERKNTDLKRLYSK